MLHIWLMAGAGVLDLHFRESMKSNLQHEVNFLKNSGFHKTVKMIFSMKPVSEDPRNYLTLLIPKIFVVEWLLMFFRVIPDKHFLIWCKEVF